jgi:hypothetical protein
LNTVGGCAPSTWRDVPTDPGNKAFMPYTADYFFLQRSRALLKVLMLNAEC